jgi:predicted MPP superfamily phosphohydrolase
MKIFACSDIHSYFTPFKKALDEKGFEPNNPEHLLVVCGDVFDRGGESVEVLDYLNSLINVVLVRGNHEDLLEEMLKRGYGEGHDISNGTVRTVGDLADITDKKNSKSTKECCDTVKELITPFLNRMIYYFETKNYIFVHSWIPCKAKYEPGANKPWYQYGKTYEYMEDWRSANEVDWEEARWGNPFQMAQQGLNRTGKTIVFGHWHTSWPRAYYEGQPEFGEGADFNPYFGEGIIGLDACTAHTDKVNVVVLEDDLLTE